LPQNKALRRIGLRHPEGFPRCAASPDDIRSGGAALQFLNITNERIQKNKNKQYAKHIAQQTKI
jgi:hypothetical protein